MNPFITKSDIWKRHRSGIYLIELSNKNETFQKIGVSINKYCRFNQIAKHGYNVRIIYFVTHIHNKHINDKLELILHSFFNHLSYIPKTKFPGYTECFKNIDTDKYKSIFNGIAYYGEVIENYHIKAQ